jgi:hypothetical protein
MKRLFLSAAVLGMLFTACKDDETNNPEPETPVKLLAMDVSEVDSVLLDYDATKKLALYELHELEGDEVIFAKPVYENNRVTSFLAGVTRTDITHKALTFAYNSAGKLLKVSFHSMEDDGINQYDSLAYDASGHLAAIYSAEVSGAGTDLGFYEKNSFEWDVKGNVSKKHRVRIEGGEETGETYTTAYTYDDKVNYAVKQPELYVLHGDEVAEIFSANNVLTAVSNFEDNSQTITNTYTYDAENYPVTKIAVRRDLHGDTEIGTSTETHRLTYIKK